MAMKLQGVLNRWVGFLATSWMWDHKRQKNVPGLEEKTIALCSARFDLYISYPHRTQSLKMPNVKFDSAFVNGLRKTMI